MIALERRDGTGGWPDFGGPLPAFAWTAVGGMAIPLWATWPSLASVASQIPVFQMLCGAFLVGWAVLQFARDGVGKAADMPVTRVAAWMPPVFCAMGLLGANAFFVMALDHIPAAQANLLSYTWPVMIVLLSAALGFFRFRLRHGAGLVLGFAGVFCVIGGGEQAVFSLPGIALGLGSGLAWAGFCVFRIWQGPKAGDVLKKGCLISAGASLLLHLFTEVPVVPAPEALLATAGVGVLPLALANLAWDQGIRKGDARLLSIMAYATPIVGLAVLAAFGLAELSWPVAAGGVLVVAAGIVSSWKGRAG